MFLRVISNKTRTLEEYSHRHKTTTTTPLTAKKQKRKTAFDFSMNNISLIKKIKRKF